MRTRLDLLEMTHANTGGEPLDHEWDGRLRQSQIGHWGQCSCSLGNVFASRGGWVILEIGSPSCLRQLSISGTAWGKIFSALKCDHDQRWAGSCANYLKGVVSYLTEARDHMIEDTRFGILIFDRVRRITAATPFALFPPELFPLLAIRTPAALRAQEFGV